MYDLYTVYSLYITIYDYINNMLKQYYNNNKIIIGILYYIIIILYVHAHYTLDSNVNNVCI